MTNDIVKKAYEHFQKKIRNSNASYFGVEDSTPWEELSDSEKDAWTDLVTFLMIESTR